MGWVERFNGTLKAMLKKLCAEQPRQWHRFINALLFAYREVPQESTGFSPFELLYGRTVRGPMHILKELWTENVDVPETKTSYQYVFELREKLEATLELARAELEKAQNKGKHHYDCKAKHESFEQEIKFCCCYLRTTINSSCSGKALMSFKKWSALTTIKSKLAEG